MTFGSQGGPILNRSRSGAKRSCVTSVKSEIERVLDATDSSASKTEVAEALREVAENKYLARLSPTVSTDPLGLSVHRPLDEKSFSETQYLFEKTPSGWGYHIVRRD